MLKMMTIGLALVGASAAAAPAVAFDAFVTGVDKNKDGSATYHFAVRTGPDETLGTAEGKTGADFFTIYNFYGFADGSAKAPAGWAFSSEEFGRTPTANGYPTVLPLDVPNTPNLTWTAAKPVAPGSQVDGFSATTQVGTSVAGQYSAQITHRVPAAAGLPASASGSTKQAVLGTLPTPTFLAPVK